MPTIAFRITHTADTAALLDQIEPKMVNVGNAMARRAQRLVPKRTWDLHDTITAETRRVGKTIRTEVGAGGDGVDYALYVERGTSVMAAQPYLRRALLQTRAADLNVTGSGPARHGHVTVITRRATSARRARGRS